MFLFYTHASSSIVGTIFSGIQSSLIGRFGIIMEVNLLYTYRTKMNGKDLKVSLRDEDRLNVCFYGVEGRKALCSP